MMPRDQTSLNRGEYEPLWANCPPWHSRDNGFLEKGKLCGWDLPTWAHVIGATCSELFTERVGRGQPKIGDGET